MSKNKLIVSPNLILLVGVISISFSSIFIKWATASASILGMYRLLITVIILIPFLPVGKLKAIFKEMTAKDWLLMVLSGLFLGLHFLFWMDSLKYTTVASSMIITTLEPVFVMIGAYFIFKEKVARYKVLSIFIAIMGSMIIASGDIGLSNGALYGDLLSLLGTIAVAIHMLAGQSLVRKIPSSIYNFFIFLIGGLVLFIYNIFNNVSLVDYPSNDWIIFILLALIPNVLGHVLFNWLLKYVSATTISMSILGEPVGAIILAYFLLGEYVTTTQVIGGIISFIGISLFLVYKPSAVRKKEKMINPNA